MHPTRHFGCRVLSVRQQTWLSKLIEHITRIIHRRKHRIVLSDYYGYSNYKEGVRCSDKNTTTEDIRPIFGAFLTTISYSNPKERCRRRISSRKKENLRCKKLHVRGGNGCIDEKNPSSGLLWCSELPRTVSSRSEHRSGGTSFPTLIGTDGEMMTSTTTIRRFLSELAKLLRFHAQTRGRHAACVSSCRRLVVPL